MSSNSHSTVEFAVVKKNLCTIASLVPAAYLPVLASRLFSVDLIGELEHSNAMNSNLPSYSRSIDLTMRVLSKIKNDSSCYKVFISALRDADLGSVAEVLESSLNSSPNVISEICNSGRMERILSSLKKMILEGEGLHMLYDLRLDEVSEFTECARQVSLIPQHVVDDLKVMHPSVLHESRCRYLMLHISKAISHDCRPYQGSMMDKFINLIRKYLNLEQLSCQYSKVPSEGLKKAQMAICNIKSDLVLRNMDLERLYKVLSDHCLLWFSIGIALGFTDNDLENILKHNGHNNSRCLYSLLQKWLTRKCDDDDANAPTFKNLSSALCKSSIGLESVVDKVSEILKIPVSMRNFDKGCVNKDDSNIQIYISCDISLREHNFPTVFLLETEVNCGDIVQHHWYKNGEYLCCSPSVYKNHCILRIEVRDIQVEQVYTYMCSLGDEQIWSGSIVVNVETFLCEHRPQLTSRYNSHLEVPVEEHGWPIVSQNTFINLAVVGECSTMSSKCYRQTIRGNADDVLKVCKAIIEYKNAFQDIKHGDRVLIVGRPGSGKTTLVHRVSKDWANGEILGPFKALFFIYLRGFRSNPGIYLRDLVSGYFNKEQTIDTVCKYIEEHEGLGVCFILDGLDEYQPEEDQDTTNFIFQLIKGSVLPHAVVIVASRPAAVSKFTKIARRQVEVLGFFKEQVEEYINSYSFSSDSMQSALIKYLNHHPNIQHMCYLPIQAAMICFLFNVCGDTLPNTETGIYEEFTKHTVLRALYRKDGSRQRTLLSLKCLKGEEKVVFFEICKVAFEKTKSSQQAIQQEEIIKTDGNQINDSLGLITIDRKATLCGFQNMYSFCHLTLQEFLAAYHISTLDAQEQLAIIQHCGSIRHMYMVFKFYCGLVKFEKDCIQFKRLLEVSEFETSHQVHCCFESQQPATCDLVVDRNRIVVDRSFSTPRDFTSLGYVVMNATQNIVRILEFVHEISVDDECGEAFMNATVRANKGAVPVELLVCTYDKNYISVKLVQACSSLLVVQLVCIDTSLPDDVYLNVEIVCINGTIELEDSLFKKFPKLNRLCIMGNNIVGELNSPHFFSVHCNPISTFCNDNFQRAEALTIAYHMMSILYCVHYDKKTTNKYTLYCRHYDEKSNYDIFNHKECLCTNLCIFNCNINNETAALLAGGLKYNTSLEVVKLVANSIGDEGAVAIAGSIKGCSSLYYLDLSLNRVSDRGAIALLSCIEGRSHFNLLLFGNYISDTIASKECCVSQRELWHTMDITECIEDEGLAHVVSIMKDWTPPLSIARTLHTVYLQSCNNSSDCIGEVVKVLSRFTSLQSVSLIDMNIHDESVESLAGSIQYQSITVLNLSHNSIGNESVADIAEAIKQCKMLSELDLSGNCIKDAGTELLSSALKSCKLQRLNLSSNDIGDTGALAIAGVLACSLKCIQDLCLSFNRFSDVGAICLARGLKDCSSLKELHLSGNCIGDTGAEALAKPLQTCHQLSSLYLSNNTIGDTGAEALAKSLQTCHQFSSLSLSDNEIGDTGAHHLGKYLKHCSSLQNLKLNDNLICGVGAAEVAKGVKHCSSLHTLEMGGHILLLGDINRLAEILKDCHRLRRLYVASDYILHDEEMELIDIDKYLPSCQVIVMIQEFDKVIHETLYEKVIDFL